MLFANGKFDNLNKLLQEHSKPLRFTNAKTGVYCGPLKMLAVEVFNKTNERGVDCDLGCLSKRVFAVLAV